MRYLLFTSHDQKIDLFKHRGQVICYGALGLALLIAPQVLGAFFLSELTHVLIFAIAGVGLMILTGYTGLVSLGHGAFLGVGAYANAFLLAQGVPFVVSFPAAGLMSAAVGYMLAFPVLRLTGIYLVMATYAFSLILTEAFNVWVPVTGGLNGMRVIEGSVFGYSLTRGAPLYYLSLGVLTLVVLAALNLLRSDTGRAFIAIRDSQIAAQSLGIDLTRYKTLAFALSAGATGLAGALLGHRLGFISPEAFNFVTSLELLLIVVVGGLGSIYGAIFGAVFIGLLPQAIAMLRDRLPEYVASQPGLDSGVFGLILMLVILLEPGGIHGVWVRIRAYVADFPLHPRAASQRQKRYMRSERT